MAIEDIKSIQNLITAEAALRKVSIKDQRDYLFLMIKRYNAACDTSVCSRCALSSIHVKDGEVCGKRISKKRLQHILTSPHPLYYKTEEIVKACHKRADYFMSIIDQFNNKQYPFV